MKTRPNLTLTTAAVLLASCGAVHATAISTFNANDEGWSLVSFTNLSLHGYSIVGTYTPIYSATGGNPGGYISSTDPDGGDFTFAAPAAVRAEFAAAYGTVLSYELTHTGTLNYQAADVILAGGGLQIVWQSSSPLAPTSGWTPISVTLAPSPQWHLTATNGALATQSDFQTVLANTTGFFIRGEYTDGAETTGLDNVRVVPEPSAFGLLLTGTALSFLCRRSHNRKMA